MLSGLLPWPDYEIHTNTQTERRRLGRETGEDEGGEKRIETGREKELIYSYL